MAKATKKKPRKLSTVEFIPPKGHEDCYPFKTDAVYLFLGEIPNMPGHCAIVDGGKVYFGYHTEMFDEVED